MNKILWSCLPLVRSHKIHEINTDILFFLNINQLDALNFIISLFQASTCFEHHVLIVRRAKLYYTVSGIVTPITPKFYNKFISSLYMFRAHVLIVRRAKLYYTVSGIVTPIGVMIPDRNTYRYQRLYNTILPS